MSIVCVSVSSTLTIFTKQTLQCTPKGRRECIKSKRRHEQHQSRVVKTQATIASIVTRALIYALYLSL